MYLVRVSTNYQGKYIMNEKDACTLLRIFGESNLVVDRYDEDLRWVKAGTDTTVLVEYIQDDKITELKTATVLGVKDNE